MDDEDEQATGYVATHNPPQVPPATAAAAPPHAPGPAAPTVTVAPQTIDAVLQSQRASAGAEPTPPGREYATLLAEIVAEAKSNGAPNSGDRMADAAARGRTRTVVESIARRREGLPAGVTPERLIRDATAEIAGAGAIESALDEADVTTVVVDSNGRVLVGRGDALGLSPFWFSADAAVVLAVDRLLHGGGVSRKNDTSVDAVLPDGTRVLAILPPAAPSGPTVVIERPAQRPPTMVDLVARRMITQQAASLIGHAISARRNLVVSGPRQSGRTSMFGALAAAIVANERCVLVEGRREVSKGLRDVTALEAHGDWKRAIDAARRLQPNRLLIGDASEASSGAFASLLATGYEGCIFVAEGPSPIAALTRIATLAAADGALTREEALARIAATRPLVIHLGRFADGTCRVVSIGEARGGEAGGVHVDEAFALRIDGTGADGKLSTTLTATGVVPSFAAS